MTNLATPADVEALLGRALTSEEETRIAGILTKLSELFRFHSGQEFTPGRSVVRRKVNAGEAWLTQRPVTEIHSVTDDSGNTLDYTYFGQKIAVPTHLSHEFVIVDYSHGGEVPELVVSTIADAARQVLSINPNAAEGVTQYSETTGPFTEQYTYATWAQGGATRLTPDDIAVAESYRVRYPKMWVTRA